MKRAAVAIRSMESIRYFCPRRLSIAFDYRSEGGLVKIVREKRKMENNEDVSGTCKINVTNDAKFIVWQKKKKKNKFCSLRTFLSREIESFCKLIGVYD